MSCLQPTSYPFFKIRNRNVQLYQETVYRRHPMAESRRQPADVAFPDCRRGNPKRREPDRARGADGDVCRRGRNRRRVRTGALHAQYPNAAAADQPEKLGQTL